MPEVWFAATAKLPFTVTASDPEDRVLDEDPEANARVTVIWSVPPEPPIPIVAVGGKVKI